MGKSLTSVLSCLFILFQFSNLDSFEIGTHRQISGQAVVSSDLDTFLKSQLGFSAGIGTEIAGTTITKLFEEGSEREDDGLRFCNHFHNPLRTWDQAGLQLLVPVCRTSNESAVVWGQNPAQGFSWQFARDEYFKGLTAKTPTEREEHLANTFRTLGQLIHLAQDTALPQHTRNDSHPVWNGLEGYVENIRSEGASGNGEAQTLFNSWINSSVGFDQTILTLSPNPLAPIPVARIIDTTDPEQTSAIPRSR